MAYWSHWATFLMPYTLSCLVTVFSVVPSPLLRYWTSIRHFQRPLSCVLASSWLQVRLIFLMTWGPVTRCFSDRQFFLFPWGFHIRACLVVMDALFLSVYLIHLHLLLLISLSPGNCCVFYHKSTQPILSGQRIRLNSPQTDLSLCIVLIFHRKLWSNNGVIKK